jgi:hypothetical protein
MMPRLWSSASSIPVFFLSSLVTLAGLPASAVEVAQPVSPGEPGALASVEGRCPTFSWSQSAGAEGYELVVVRLPEDLGSGVAELERAFEENIDTRPTLRLNLPAGSSSWTPSGKRCFESGNSYAWTLRPLGLGNEVEWSEVYLFEVLAPPSALEVRDAMETLQRYLQEAGNLAVLPIAVGTSGVSSVGAQLPAAAVPIPSLSSVALTAVAETGSAAGGVKGLSDSAAGIAGIFQNTNASGTILSGQNATNEVFKVDSSGVVTATSFIGDGSGLTGVGGGSGVVAAFAASDNLAEPTVGVMTTVLQATIEAPAAGVLLISAAVDVDNLTASDAVECRIRVDTTAVVGSHMYTAQDSSANANEEENCTTVAARTVIAGSHTVDFQVLRGDAATSIWDGTLSVLWAPASP